MTNDLTRDDLVKRLDNLAAVTDERAYAPIFKAAARRIEGLRATSEGWRLQAEEAQAEADRRVEEEREWTEREARRYAAFYPEGSDGRNTFTIFADAIRARSNEAQPGSKAEVRAEPSGSVAPSPVAQERDEEWRDPASAPREYTLVRAQRSPSAVSEGVNPTPSPIGCADEVKSFLAGFQCAIDIIAAQPDERGAFAYLTLFQENGRRNGRSLSEMAVAYASHLRAQHKASNKAWDDFQATLDNPPPANDALKELMRSPVQTGAAGSVPEALGARSVLAALMTCLDRENPWDSEHASEVSAIMDMARRYLSASPPPPVQERQEVGGGEFKPDWTLTETERAIVALSLALPKHIPGWPGCTDEQMEAVATAVLSELHREPQPVGGGWQDISTAPKTRPIVVETEAGRIFKAKWVVVGDDAVGWGTVNEDDPCPTCWTDGFCWESNADEEPSDKPVRWCELHKHSPLPSPPELQSEPVGGSNE